MCLLACRIRHCSWADADVLLMVLLLLLSCCLAVGCLKTVNRQRQRPFYLSQLVNVTGARGEGKAVWRKRGSALLP